MSEDGVPLYPEVRSLALTWREQVELYLSSAGHTMYETGAMPNRGERLEQALKDTLEVQKIFLAKIAELENQMQAIRKALG